MKTFALLVLLFLGTAQAQTRKKDCYQVPVPHMQKNGRVVVYWVTCRNVYLNRPSPAQIQAARIKMYQIYLRKMGAR